MNIVLWIIQAILAIKLVTVVITHGFQQSKSTMQEAIGKSGGNPKPLLYGVAMVSLLASIPFHLRCREKPKVFVSLILFMLVCAVYYGRWILFI